MFLVSFVFSSCHVVCSPVIYRDYYVPSHIQRKVVYHNPHVHYTKTTNILHHKTTYRNFCNYRHNKFKITKNKFKKCHKK